MTYSHVFLDEFQDTTVSQWDLITSAFSGSDSVLTAVGDGKQRIMVWAVESWYRTGRRTPSFQVPGFTFLRNDDYLAVGLAEGLLSGIQAVS